MNNSIVGVKSAMRSTVSKHEQLQKAKFVEKASDKTMRYADFLAYVENEIKQSKVMATFNYNFPCFKNDGVFQLNRAIQEVFGLVAAMKGESSPSNDEEEAVNTIEVILANGERVKVPYGDIALEELGKDSKISISYNTDQHRLYVKGKCQQKYSTLIDDIIDRTKWLLANESIYRGQALEITDPSEPSIMDLSNIHSEMMILSKQTKYELQPLESRILHPEVCIEKGIPLKFGAILEGNYGTGKTLLAFKLATKAILNNWMFVYLKDPTLLAETIRLCKVIDNTGYGVIIFTEDVDQVTRGDRDAAMQDILNTLDGGDTKGMNVITLFTTNHIELIEPTFLRGKRIGSVISLGTLDAETAEVFVKEAFKDGYTLKGDFTKVYQLIEEKNIVPAFMAEIVESVKGHMIFMDNSTEVLPEYIESSVNSYLRQVALSHKKDMNKKPEEIFVESLQQIIGKEKLEDKVDEIFNLLNE